MDPFISAKFLNFLKVNKLTFSTNRITVFFFTIDFSVKLFIPIGIIQKLLLLVVIQGQLIDAKIVYRHRFTRILNSV